MRFPLTALIILVVLAGCVSNSSVIVPENSSSTPAVFLTGTARIHDALTDQAFREAGTATPIPNATHTYTLTPYRTPTITPPAPVSYLGPLPAGLIGRLGAGHFSQLAASPDGNRVAVASSVGIYIYRSEAFEQERIIPTEEVTSIAWSPNGKWLATGIGEKIIIWDASTGSQLQVLNVGVAHKIRWSPDNDSLAVLVSLSTYAHALRVWKIGDATLRYSLDKTQLSNRGYGDLKDIDWSSTGRLVVTDGEQVRVLDGETGKTIYQFEYLDSPVTFTTSWSPDGSVLALVTSNMIKLLNASDGSEKQTFLVEDGPIISYTVAWSPNGRYLVMSRIPRATYGLAIAVWDLKSAQWVDEFYGHTYPAASLAWLDGATKIASIQDDGGLLIVWDLETKVPEHVLRGNGGLRNLAWSPDGKTISATDGGHIFAWSISSGRSTLEAEVSTDAYMNYAGIRDMALSQDGSRYAVVWGDDGRYLETWNAQTGLQDDFHVEAEPGIAWSPDGKYMVGGTRNGEVNIWDSQTGLALFEYDLDIRFESPYGASVDWSSDGRTIAAVSGGRIHLLDFPLAKTWLPLENCGEHIYDLAWSPDGNKIAAFSSAGTVNICDPKTDRLLVRLKGVTEQAESTDFEWSSDGRLLAVSSFRLQLISSRLQIAENRVVVWDTRTWQPIRILEGKSPFYSVAFSPDRKALAIGSGDGTIWLIEP